jgi:O-antigen/teichoic acid export membrane protein
LILEVLSGMALFFPLILGLTYIFFPLMVFLFLPKYLPSLTCIRFMIIGSFFFIFQGGTYNFIVTINRQVLIVKVELICIGVSLLVSYLLLHQGWGIEGVALATMGAKALSSLIFLMYSLSLLFSRSRDRSLYLGGLFFPFLLVVPVLILMDYLWGLQGDWKGDLGKTSLKAGCLLVLMAPFLWRLKEKVNVFWKLISPKSPAGT